MKKIVFISSIIFVLGFIFAVFKFEANFTASAVETGSVCIEDADCNTLSNTCGIGKCRFSTGVCYLAPLPNGSLCNDGNSCTTGDKCFSGICKAHKLPVGTYCDDESACTEFEKCNIHGQCIGVKKITDDNNRCTKDWCDPKKGVINEPIAQCSI